MLSLGRKSYTTFKVAPVIRSQLHGHSFWQKMDKGLLQAMTLHQTCGAAAEDEDEI